MKVIIVGPGGVLENAIWLVGYESLCIMLYEDPELATKIFEAIGSRIRRYYELSGPWAAVGACISNDDWGFKTQTMLSTAQMHKYVLPWHDQIVQTIHAAGKPAILHSCGRLDTVMDDIVDGLHYDGKHSYEDAITPVEQMYERWSDKIAIMGGIDVDFVIRSAPEDVTRRCKAMLEADRRIAAATHLGRVTLCPNMYRTTNTWR